MSDIGQRIMEYIINANMVHSDCVDDKEHGVLSVWSASTTEQIEAMVEEEFEKRANQQREETKMERLFKIGVVVVFVLMLWGSVLMVIRGTVDTYRTIMSERVEK